MRKYDWSKERVTKAVEESNCWFNCLDNLGIPKKGYNYAKTHNGKHYEKRNCNRTDQETFSFGAMIKTSSLKKEYISRVLHGNAKCEVCGPDFN